MKAITEYSEKELKEALIEKEKEKRNIWACDGLTPSVFDTFVSYKCENINDMKKVLDRFEPYRHIDEVSTATKKYYTTKPVMYRVGLNNNYYDREFKIVFGLLNIDVWLSINTNNLPSDFIEKFLNKGTRGLYDTESHYVNLPAHYKKFKNIRIPAYGFKSSQLDFYGGNKTLLDTDMINEIINYIKS